MDRQSVLIEVEIVRVCIYLVCFTTLLLSYTVGWLQKIIWKATEGRCRGLI
jgi:hypothetical protein